MRSFCFELKTTCKSCGNPLPVNALSGSIYCNVCSQKNTISVDNWKSLINDNIGEISRFGEGEGRNSKIFMGEYEFSLLMGKQKARCPECKTTIPDTFFESENTSEYTCTKCGNIVMIRKPDEFVLKVLPFTVFLANEDASQYETNKEGIKLPKTAKPVLFNCPSCAANLEIDGTARMINCKSCGSKIYLPDDLWQELHPAKSVARWYLVLDDAKMEKEQMPEWNSIDDVAADSKGNIYFAGEEDDTDNFLLFSMGPDRKIRWVRRDIKFQHEYSGITVTKNNKLLLWNKDKRSLLVFSCADGKDLTGIKGAEVTKENPYPFNLKECTSLVSDTDNTILALVYETFVRFYEDGTRAALWSDLQKGEKHGFFGKMFGYNDVEIDIPPKREDYPPKLSEIEHRPRYVSGDVKMNMGHDGFLYILYSSSENGIVTKYDRKGNRLWEKGTSNLSNYYSKPFADKNGFVYVLGKDENGKSKLLRYSPDGKDVQIILKDITEGGLLGEERYLAVSPEGIIYIFDSYGSLKIISPELKLIFISEHAKEDDADRQDDEKEKKEKREEKD